MSLMMGGDAGISAFPDGDNIFQWTGTITGGAGTVRHLPRASADLAGLDPRTFAQLSARRSMRGSRLSCRSNSRPATRTRLRRSRTVALPGDGGGRICPGEPAAHDVLALTPMPPAGEMVCRVQRAHHPALDPVAVGRCRSPRREPVCVATNNLLGGVSALKRACLSFSAADPNLDSPLNGHAATLWNNQPEFKRALLKHKSNPVAAAERRA
eukprot:scaffold25881_cov129-Isochrysis_galbana.AAC.6